MGDEKKNYLAVTEGFGTLSEALRPFIQKSLEKHYSSNWWKGGVIGRLSAVQRENLSPRKKDMEELDISGLLNVINNNWQAAFNRHKTLTRDHRTWVNELISVRNSWAHSKNYKFSDDDSWRALDTMSRFANAINKDAGKQLRKLADSIRATVKKAEPAKSEKVKQLPVKKELKPWYDVIEPNSEVMRGDYSHASFAADLSEVVKGTASFEYSDPVEFFSRTYLTEGMSILLENAIRRLQGKGGEPVVQVKTAFGGGKTHTMLALYHLLGGKAEFGELQGLGDLIEKLDLTELPQAKFAVIVGTALNVDKPRKVAGLEIRTLWGEIAYQIGGKKGYQKLEANDKSGTNPGSDTLQELFDEYGPCVILIDELAKFVGQIYSANQTLPAGSFDANIAFIQSVTEAADKSMASMIIASLPESELEKGGEGGKEALRYIEHHFGRKESVWKPVSWRESFEIVRRRLFRPVRYPGHRDRVCSAFAKMYDDNPNDFPSEAQGGKYQIDLKNSYPVHPEFFQRLYDDWSTLESFQRTRGVLRLMASTVRHLWNRRDGSLMIMPGSIPINELDVREELIRYIPEEWNAVIDSEVAGEGSKPYVLDQENPRFRRLDACKRVAATIFMGSAATSGKPIRGIEDNRLRLGMLQPGEQIAHCNDALSRLRDSLSHLFNESGRYWLDTTPNLRHKMRDFMSRYSKDDIMHEAKNRLQSRSSKFSTVRVAADSADIPDDRELKLVILSLYDPHVRNQDETPALESAQKILNNRGDAPRNHKNTVVFAAADQRALEDVEESVRQYLAWDRIVDHSDQMDLKASDIKMARRERDRAEEVTSRKILESYAWALVPKQTAGENSVGWEALPVSGDTPVAEKVYNRLKRDELVVEALNPALLKDGIEKWLWKDGPHVKVEEIWDLCTKYLYFYRLSASRVLQESIQGGVETAEFGYANSIKDDGSYSEIKFRVKGATTYLDAKSVLIKSEVAHELLKQEPPEGDVPSGETGGETGGGFEPFGPQIRKRYSGSVEINPDKISRDILNLDQEVLDHLRKLKGTKVTITMEIEAVNAEEIPENVRNIVKENAKTLKFKHSTFE